MPSNTADRNLLFGILAVQMGFVSRDALIEAMNAWALDRARPLGALLTERGALNAAHRGLLDSLVDEHMKLHAGDPIASLAAVESASSVRVSIASRVEDPEIQASLAAARQARAAVESRLAAAVPDADPPCATTSYDPSRDATLGGRFRILRAHAEGGLGAVFIAVDTELSREVALKQMKSAASLRADSRARFVLEAEITGGLEHPGIVPVYSLGHDATGQPFYAMRFIRGDSLAEAIKAFHKHWSPAGAPSVASSQPRPRWATPGHDPSLNLAITSRELEFRGLLRRFIDVCNAIAYAHSRGVLHRDLKPANIMLGRYGETLVVDWGLAKATGYSDAIASLDVDKALQPSAASGTAETMPGSALGTPQFMPPEQAAGRLDLLGPRSDVYALGATLYTILTGKPPVEGSDHGEILRKVQRGEVTPPRTWDRSIPRSLEAICLKAMAVSAEDRYDSCRALADEIERWLADEPVRADREPWSERSRRWARKHRTLAISAAAVLLMALAGSAVVAAVVTTKNRALIVQRDRAENREQLAINAVKRFRDVVVQSPELKNSPALESLRKTLLKEPLAFFKALRERLLADRDTRPASLSRLASAVHDLAYLTDQIGDKEDALKAYEEALAINDRLARENRAVTQFQSELAASHNRRGILQSELGRTADALDAYSKALKIRERLARQNPAVTQFQSELATSHNNMGNLQSAMGRTADALDAHSKAIKVRERLARENPAVTRFQRDLADSHNNMGLLQRELGRTTDALDAYSKAIKIWERLARENPAVTEFQSGLATSHNNMGNLQREMGRTADALDAYAKALKIRERLARENPAVTRFRSELAGSHNSMGVLQKGLGRTADALDACSQALKIQERLARENPAVTQFRRDLAVSHNTMGVLLRAMRRTADALNAFSQALKIQERLAREYPQSPDYASDLGGTLNNMALIDADEQRWTEARGRLEQAVVWQKKGLAANPKNPKYRQFLTNHLTNLIRVAKALGNETEAAQAQVTLNNLKNRDSGTMALDAQLAAVLKGDRRPAGEAEQLRLAFRAYEKSLYAASTKLFAEALANDPRLAEDRQAQHRYNAACAAAMAGCGQGKDDPKPGAEARVKLRNQARGWLEAELAVWAQQLEAGDDTARTIISKILAHWQLDTDLDGVRDPGALTKLPDAERAPWTRLWTEVKTLLSRAMPATVPVKVP